MDNAKQQEQCAGCESLKHMVRWLSALVDMQDLPRGFTVENYRRLINGKPLRLKRPKPIAKKRR